jgi:phosphate-selective porin OprO/OprP
MKRDPLKHHRRFDKPAQKRQLALFLFLSLITVHFLVCISCKIAMASPEDPKQINEAAGLQTEHDHPQKPTKMHIYWKDGLHIKGRYNQWDFVVGGSVMLDAGQLNADEEIEQAFPGFTGNAADIRQLRMHSLFRSADFLDFRLDMDFANVREIKDNWIRFTTIPFIKHIQFGNQKEPFSLEGLTSSQVNLFMEEALPNMAFGPGRNLGARYNNHFFNERLSVWGGAFWNTGSYSDVGDAKDQMSESLGFSSSMRISTSKALNHDRKHFLHAGLSYRYLAQRSDKPIRLDARPESYLTDDRLVDTGEFQITDGHILNPEFALVYGPLSIQGEYFHSFWGAEIDLDFRGYYLSSSYFLTGESRNYRKKEGIFSAPILNRKFNPRERQWGALELGLRYSFIDLNDQNIHGGEETNITAGLNWYLFPKTRFMFNYVHTRVRNRKLPTIESGYSDIFMLRFQKGF